MYTVDREGVQNRMVLNTHCNQWGVGGGGGGGERGLPIWWLMHGYDPELTRSKSEANSIGDGSKHASSYFSSLL